MSEGLVEKRGRKSQLGKKRGKYKKSENKRAAFTAEHRARISESVRNRPRSPLTDQQRKNISDGVKRSQGLEEEISALSSPNQWTMKDISSQNQFNERMRLIREEDTRCRRLEIEPAKKLQNGFIGPTVEA